MKTCLKSGKNTVSLTAAKTFAAITKIKKAEAAQFLGKRKVK